MTVVIKLDFTEFLNVGKWNNEDMAFVNQPWGLVETPQKNKN